MSISGRRPKKRLTLGPVNVGRVIQIESADQWTPEWDLLGPPTYIFLRTKGGRVSSEYR